MSSPTAAVITGSTSGIGLGMARSLASRGINIMLNGLGDADEIESTRLSIEQDFGVRVHFHGADMTEPDEIADLIAATRTAFGSVDILINNAGIQHVAPVDEFPTDKWDRIIAINLSSSFHTIHHALPHMKAAGWGRIINLASAHALRASPYKAAYVAAKHGVAGLTKTVALEVAEQNITCNAICPGYVWTPLVANQVADTARTRGITEEQVKKDVMLLAQPTKQFVTVEEIGEFAAFLCTDSAKNITGAILPMEGGWTAK